MDKEKFLAHIKSHEVTSCSKLAAFTNLTVKSRDDICLLLDALKKKAKYNSKYTQSDSEEDWLNDVLNSPKKRKIFEELIDKDLEQELDKLSVKND